MAKKKKDSKPKEFDNNPFKSLKGLSVSAAEDPSTQKETPSNKEQYKSKAPVRDDLDFLEAMADLGVKGNTKHGVTTPKPPPPKPEEPEEDGEALMLEALGHMDVCFVDSFPEEDPGHRAQPRRMKQVEKGLLSPETELDLHGMFSDGVVQKVAWFLEDASRQGHRVVRIITGAGHRSNEGPVLRPLVEKFLSGEKAQHWVVEWGRAPKRHGGDGALIVFLRK